MSQLLTNLGWLGTFRQSPQGAASVAHLLPELVGTSRQAFGRKTIEGKEARIRAITGLEHRELYLANMRHGLGAVKVHTPEVDLDGLRRAADQAPQWLRDACLAGGAETVTRHEMDQVIERRRAHIRRVMAGHADTPLPNFSGEVYEVKAAAEQSESAGQSGITDAKNETPRTSIEQEAKAVEPVESDDLLFLG